MTVFALYVAEQAGPVDTEDGVCSCVGLFGDVTDALAAAAENLVEGYSVWIDVGAMTDAEWDALEEVPDDFSFTQPPDDAAVDPSADASTGTPPTREASSTPCLWPPRFGS